MGNSKIANNKIKNLYFSNTQEINEEAYTEVKPVENKLSKLKVHRGPLNLNAITMRNPINLIEEICEIVTQLGISYRKLDSFNLKCEFKDLKFMIEINYVEKFDNLFIIKFYKNNQTNNKYFELCSNIFSLINL